MTEDLPTNAGEAPYEEAFDPELFEIFLEQLAEGLTSLDALTAALPSADRTDRIGILENCLTRIDPLRSSANYMGYDPLTALYDGWSEAIRNACDRLHAGDEAFMSDFIHDTMGAQIAAVASRFPQLNLKPETTEAPRSITEVAIPDETTGGTSPAETTGIGRVKHNDAAAEDVFPTPPSPAEGPSDTLLSAADLFDRLSRSFDDGRQQRLASSHTADTSVIATELFSTGDRVLATDDSDPHPTPSQDAVNPSRQSPEDAPPPIEAALFTNETESTLAPETPPSDGAAAQADMAPPDKAGLASDRDDYDEAYDEELFTYFLAQLTESLGALKAHARLLPQREGRERLALLEASLQQLELLRSAANYMGYTRLTAFYDEWTIAVQAARQRLQAGESEFLNDFIAADMEAPIAAVTERFPQVRGAKESAAETLPAPHSDIAPQATEAALTGAPSTDLPPAEEGAAGWMATTADRDRSGETEPFPDPIAIDSDAQAESTLLNDFIVETVEHLEEMETSLLRLEKAPAGSETLDDIFRSAHTIKGAAEYLGMPRIADLSHQLENLLDHMRRSNHPADAETIDLLIAARDRLGLLTEDLAQNGREQTAIDDLLERIRCLPPRSADAAPAANQTAAPAENAASPEDADLDDLTLPFFAEPSNDANAPPVQVSPAPPQPGDPAAPHRPMADSVDSDPTRPRQCLPATTEGHAPDRPPDRIGPQMRKQNIRVDTAKIDALMNQVGELVVSRAWFSQLFSEMRELQQNLKQRFKRDTREMKQVKGLTFRLSEATVALGRVANDLQEGVMKVRMLPIAQLFNRYPRLVFDLARDTGKKVALDIRGEDTELDKMVIEEISDPLMHIIRNAVDHGVETVVERRERGKPETATIRLEAYHEGNHVVIEIADDGQGLDLERIRAKALAGNFARREELVRMPPKELTGLILRPGFSTTDKVTHTSGRGVGMDVVKKNIEKLNGTIEIDTTPGRETRLRIKIPLTLAIIPALLIKVRQELFTIPLATVEETLHLAVSDVSTIEGVEVMQLRESTLPLVRLDSLFNMPVSTPIERSFVVVVSTGMKRVGLVVDELLGQEEVVIKPLEDYLQEHSGFSGATILGDGRISLILDAYELVNLSIDREARKKAKVAAR